MELNKGMPVKQLNNENRNNNNNLIMMFYFYKIYVCSKVKENATQNEDRLSNIYDNNIIRPSALYVFQDASVLCMPFAELGAHLC